MTSTMYKLHTKLTRAARAWRFLLCLAGLALAMGGWALQNSAATETKAEPAVGRIIAPTYLEKDGNPLSLQKELSWQVGGLSTQLTTKQGTNTLSFAGGIFYSRELATRSPFTLATPPALEIPSTALGLNARTSLPAGALGFASTLAPGAAPRNGKTDQAVFQRLSYQAAGLSLSGSYSDIGKDFQGIDDLKTQINPADAALFGLGTTQTNFALNYTGIRGLKLATSRGEVENNLTGSGENGLTRTKQIQSMALALGPKQSMEFTRDTTTETWNPALGRRDGKQVVAQALKWAGALGQKSSFSLGQTLAATRVGTKNTIDNRQDVLALKWNEWKNFSFSGGFTSTENGVSRQTTDVMTLDLAAALSPRLSLVGKMVDNSVNTAGNPQDVVNNLLDLALTAKLTDTLQFRSGYRTNETTAGGTVDTREQTLNWTPAKRWAFVSHLVTVANEKTDDTMMLENTLRGDIGSKKRPETLSFYSRRENLSTTLEQNRCEITYLRPVGGGAAPAKLLVQGGTYQRASMQSGKHSVQQDDLLAMQLLNLQPAARTTATFGYYNGPLLGAGYLNYRTWGQKNAGNLAVWTPQDFTPYREVGGEVVRTLSKDAKITLRQMDGQLEGIGAMRFTEYGVEQHVGKAVFTGSQLHGETPGKDAPVQHDVLLYKLVMPAARPLPAWAAASMRFSVFADGASWGFGALPAWVQPTAPASGLTLEKREVNTAAGKPVNQYTLQAAWMLTPQTCILLGHEDNPFKAGTTQADLQRRRFVHLGYALKPTMQIFGRFIDEDRKDQAMGTSTWSLGMIGQLSATSRLQVQVDGITRAAAGKSLNGTAYQFEFERTLSADNSLTLKWRLNPSEFATTKFRSQVEAAYKLVF